MARGYSDSNTILSRILIMIKHSSFLIILLSILLFTNCSHETFVYCDGKFVAKKISRKNKQTETVGEIPKEGIIQEYGKSFLGKKHLISECVYRGGLKNGKFCLWSKNGKTLLATGFSSNGKATGEAKIYDKNGRISSITNYADGMRNGLFEMYLENGSLIWQTYYHNDKLDSIDKSWYANGQLMSLTYYKNGVLSGLQTFWSSNGIKISEGTCQNGIPMGTWRSWYDNGNRKAEEEIVDGKIFTRKCWDITGNEITCKDTDLETKLLNKIMDSVKSIDSPRANKP
jgi:antitoxin component YwqK of YwqJK toxin-antitoxin module